jgi:hypothetical protein
MEQHIDQMKPPGFQAEEMIIEHIDDVHEGPIVVRDDGSCLETPDTFGKYRRYAVNVPDPWIFHYLAHVVVYKIAEKGVEIYGEAHKHYDENWDERND